VEEAVVEMAHVDLSVGPDHPPKAMRLPINYATLKHHVVVPENPPNPILLSSKVPFVIFYVFNSNVFVKLKTRLTEMLLKGK
jgi:hypothetical protein